MSQRRAVGLRSWTQSTKHLRDECELKRVSENRRPPKMVVQSVSREEKPGTNSKNTDPQNKGCAHLYAMRAMLRAIGHLVSFVSRCSGSCAQLRHPARSASDEHLGETSSVLCSVPCCFLFGGIPTSGQTKQVLRACLRFFASASPGNGKSCCGWAGCPRAHGFRLV